MEIRLTRSVCNCVTDITNALVRDMRVKLIPFFGLQLQLSTICSVNLEWECDRLLAIYNYTYVKNMAEFKVACPCTDETQFPYLDSSDRRSEFKLRDVESLVFLPVSQTDLIAVYSN